MLEVDRQYFELMESLFEHPGWKVFVDDMTGWQEKIGARWRSLTAENLKYEQGRYAGLEQASGFQDFIAALKQKALEDSNPIIDVENV